MPDAALRCNAAAGRANDAMGSAQTKANGAVANGASALDGTDVGTGAGANANGSLSGSTALGAASNRLHDTTANSNSGNQ